MAIDQQVNLKQKLSATEADVFEKIVTAADKVAKSPVCEKAKNAGVDVSKIIAAVKEENAEFSIRSGIDIAIRQVREETEIATATETTCFFLGMKDRPGSSRPCSFALLRFGAADKGGKAKVTLFEASSFDPKLETMDGKEISLDQPGEVTLKIRQNTRYKSWEIIKLVKYRPMAPEEMAAKLAFAASDPRKYSEDNKYDPIILMGEIRGVYPVNILKKNKEDDSWFTDGEYPVLVANQLKEEPVKTPVLKIGFEPVFGVVPRVTFEARQYTEPMILVEDMRGYIERVAEDIRDPKDQAVEIGKLLENRSVIVVGTVQKVSGDKTTYMEISGYSIFDAPMSVDWFGKGSEESEEKSKETSEEKKPAEKSEETKSPKGSGKGTSKGKEKEKEKPAPGSNEASTVVKFDDVKAAVLEFCTAMDIDPKTITIETVQEKIAPAAKKGIISAVLEEIQE